MERLDSLCRVTLLCTLAVALAPAQVLMPIGNGAGHILPSDNAILETREARKDLPCSVTPAKPVLGFDLKFHAGYEVAIPLRDLAGEEDQLTTIFRVTSGERPDQPFYFSQKISVPRIEEGAKGDAYLDGGFDLGEGKYHVDWMMRDRSERVCSFYWDGEAALTPRDKGMRLALAENSIEPVDREPFREEPPISRDPRQPLNVKIMVNFAPQRNLSATMQPIDTAALVSILRSIAREPRICRFSVVAFNMQEQRVIYRADNAEHIDFPALGESLHKINLGTINLARLQEKHGDSDFLTDLITREMAADHPDALIFAGPKVVADQGVPADSLKQLGDLPYPVFYMNYNLNPQQNPWRDAIGNAVKRLKGVEYTISRPRDLWVSWTDIMSRIVRLKLGRTSLTSSQ